MKLGELCILFTDGDWIESKDQSDSGIRLIQTGNIGNGEFLYKNDKAKYISVDTFKRLNCKEVFPNDILVSRLPEPVGRGCIIPDIGEKMITAVDCTICRINENLVDRKYFCYFLESNAYKMQLEQHVTGTTRKRISRKNLSSVEIDIPEQAKQKEVVYKLDRLKKIIQNYNRELDLLDELVRARFVEMFGDPRINPMNFNKSELKDTCDIITGNTPLRKNEEYYGNYIEWIKTDNIVVNKLNPTYAKESLSKEGMDVGRTVEKNCILMACIAGSISSIGRVCVTDRKVAFNQQINAIVPKKYNCMFLYVLMQVSKDYLVDGINMALKGILSKSRLEKKQFIVPPLELQNQFASFVEEIDKSRSRIQKSLEASQELFDSLMQEYFS